MQYKKRIKHSAILIAIAFGLTACTTNNELRLAESFADQRAEMLESIVPVNMNGYNLIRAKAVSDQIELTLLYSGQAKVPSPAMLAKNLTEAYCLDNEISSLMQKGVRYKLLFRDSRGRPIHQHNVTSGACGNDSEAQEE